MALELNEVFRAPLNFDFEGSLVQNVSPVRTSLLGK